MGVKNSHPPSVRSEQVLGALYLAQLFFAGDFSYDS